MQTCADCGEGSSDVARFCQFCGATLRPESVSRKTRRIVTILFTDITGSTSLAERLDPESLRKVMGLYFEEMRYVIERHGGTVEKFIGDAVMAVFGIPNVHEDDPLRAVRAASEMREALGRLNEELERDWGIAIDTRTGVNTGEVVAGDPSTGHAFATGDAVNVAARLEQTAAPGEILIGDSTYRLVRDAVLTDAREPMKLRGVEAPVGVHRLLEVVPGTAGHARRFDSPLVDRDREQTLLTEAFERAASDRLCQLFTILGPAGVGKSRLVEEFLRSAGERAIAFRGRCLPYGEGITFWPVAEILDQAAGLADSDPRELVMRKLADLVREVERGSLVVERIAQALGVAGGTASPEETLWAFRTLFEALARSHPLVLVFEDIHWAEPTLLELIEHVSDWSRDAPIMLLCLARPELLEIHPAWGGGKFNATTIMLEPLSAQDSDELVVNLLGTAELAGSLRDRVVESAGGFPLFAEEIVSMLIDEGLLARDGGHWVPVDDLSRFAIPPTISGLLAARLDRLTPEERRVVEGASVVGGDFYVGEVAALGPPELASQVGGHLMTLVRKDLIRPARSILPGEDAFRFRHILIRDAAYESLSKETRAELHERYADWLEGWAGERIEEYEEIVAYHLEQAHRYLADLGPVGEHGRELASRAGGRFAAAGRRAFARGDMPASVNLLGRTVDLLPASDPTRAEVIPDLTESLLQTGHPAQATTVVRDMLVSADTLEDPSLKAKARLWWSVVQSVTDPKTITVEQQRDVATKAIRVFEGLGETTNVASALAELAPTYWLTGEIGRMLEISERAMELARVSGNRLALTLCADYVGRAMVLGTTPGREGVRSMESLREVHAGDRMVEAPIQLSLAVLLAMMGRFGEARANITQAMAVFEDLGQRRWVTAAAGMSGLITWWHGDPEAAEPELRSSYEFSSRLGEAVWGMEASNLAQVLYELDRLDEADAVAEAIAAGTPEYELESQIEWRSVRAKILARGGDAERASRLGQEAVEMAERTELLNLQGHALLDLAECLLLAGRPQGAVPAARRALDRFDRKGNVVGGAQARVLLERLGR